MQFFVGVDAIFFLEKRCDFNAIAIPALKRLRESVRAGNYGRVIVTDCESP